MRKPGGRFWHDYALRTHIFALIAVIINLANVGANIAAAVAYSSMWYCSMAVYYFALGALRGGMLIANKQIGKRFEGGRLALAKTRMYLACGISLMVFEAALIYAVSEMVTEKVTSTGEIMAIAIAAYTFYKVIISIVNVKKNEQTARPRPAMSQEYQPDGRACFTAFTADNHDIRIRRRKRTCADERHYGHCRDGDNSDNSRSDDYAGGKTPEGERT